MKMSKYEIILELGTMKVSAESLEEAKEKALNNLNKDKLIGWRCDEE